jgi:DNA-binding transcriptional LysR family regulator
MDWADRIGSRIRLRDLHILLAVAESGSMSKAATQLAISHPVVSKTISDLEQTVGVRLFDRTSQGVELTIYGQTLLKCGVLVFDEMRQGLKQIKFLTDPNSGELRIGCPEIIVVGLLPAILKRFWQRHPRIRIHVVHAYTAMQQFQELRARNVELLIGRMPLTPFQEEDLFVETLFDEPFVSVAGNHSRWARRREIGLAELVDEPWVLPPYDSAGGTLIAEIFRINKLEPPTPALTTLSVQLTVTQVATGRFVGLLPRSVAQFSAGRLGLRILPVKLPMQLFSAILITIKHRTLSPLAERFIACVREVSASRARAK